MGGKRKYIEMFGSFTEPFKCERKTIIFYFKTSTADTHGLRLSVSARTGDDGVTMPTC